ncbi:MULTISPECIES: hypothetical protein [Brevibacterium]|nr:MULTISPECIES: hypothetical protein [Brevibacterium]MBU8578849.1 hypothetical protein [Brevibacterium luteolum]MCT1691421.1 hypothetical protein [Brevibacterium sp. p3-SID960]
MALSFTNPILVGSALGYFALREAPDIITFAVQPPALFALISVYLEA